MTYPAQLWWPGPEDGEPYNQQLARVVEVFGLPGGRYTTEVSMDSMIFWFLEPQDQLLFFLGWPQAQPVLNPTQE